MPKFCRFVLFVLAGAAVPGCCPQSYSQVYSYVDRNGTRVITNIPPQEPVYDLKVTGAPPPPPAPVATKSKSGKTAARNSARPSPPAQPAAGFSSDPASPRVPVVATHSSYDSIIEKYSSEYGVDPKLIQSMIATESAFNAKAVSPKGAQGLMQLMPSTASNLGVRNPFDPEENISGGIKHMRNLLDTFSGYPDSLVLSLAAYNAGENLVQRIGRVPAIRETNDYVRTIIQRYGKRETELLIPARLQEQAQRPMMFHFLDENGIPVLTNIPPVIRAGNQSPAPSPNQQ
jgi:hypothetical protein